MRTLLLTVLLACVGVSEGRAQGTSNFDLRSDFDVRSKIVALENLWDQAVEARDLDALNGIIDDCFVYVGPDGRLLTKPEVLADLKASHRIRAVSESMVVRLHGDTAVVTGIYRTTGVDRGKPFSRRDRFVDTWLYKKGSWVSIASLETPAGP